MRRRRNSSQAWRQLPRLRDPAKATSWLQRVTINASISRLRRRTRDKAANESLGRAMPRRLPEDEAVVRRESLRTALWQLDPEHSGGRLPALLRGT